MKKLWIVQNWTMGGGGISKHFKVFLKVKYRMGKFLGSLNLEYFFGVGINS